MLTRQLCLLCLPQGGEKCLHLWIHISLEEDRLALPLPLRELLAPPDGRGLPLLAATDAGLTAGSSPRGAGAGEEGLDDEIWTDVAKRRRLQQERRRRRPQQEEKGPHQTAMPSLSGGGWSGPEVRGGAVPVPRRERDKVARSYRAEMAQQRLPLKKIAHSWTWQ